MLKPWNYKGLLWNSWLLPFPVDRDTHDFFAAFRVTFLKPPVCFKSITWYIKMHHVMNFYASRHHSFTVLCAVCLVERRYELFCVKKRKDSSSWTCDRCRLSMISDWSDDIKRWWHTHRIFSRISKFRRWPSISSLVRLVLQNCGTALANELLLIHSGREEIIQLISTRKIWTYWKL